MQIHESTNSFVRQKWLIRKLLEASRKMFLNWTGTQNLLVWATAWLFKWAALNVILYISFMKGYYFYKMFSSWWNKNFRKNPKAQSVTSPNNLNRPSQSTFGSRNEEVASHSSAVIFWRPNWNWQTSSCRNTKSK